MKRLFPFLLLLCLVSVGFGESYSTRYTAPVSQEDGDTIVTTQPKSSCTTGCVGPASLLSAAVTNRSNRKRTFCNVSGFEVYLGTASVQLALDVNGFRLTASTGTYPCYETYSTAAFYGQSVGASSATVVVIQEKTANP